MQVRALDNVLDATFWPLPQQQAESASKRRIGVGFTGLGNTLAMLKVKYNSQEGLTWATAIARHMRDAAYSASVELAKEKGAFPLFDAEEYLAEGTFASRLPKAIKARIRKYGIRNSHLLSIAPTGTVSLAFADNASNGIEPPFSWTYTRKKREQDGSHTIHTVEDYSWRLYRHLGGDTDNLPEYFISALEMSAQDHLAMMAAVQPFIDTAISKTVNIPADYPFEDFKDLYLQAHKAKLKGLATYRPNSILGAVLATTPAPEAKPVEKDAIDLQKLVIEKRPNGPLQATSDKIEYWTQDGQKTLYLITSFLTVSDDQGNTAERAIEFFAPVGQNGESQQWMTSTMRMLSLAARGGFLEKALSDMRKVAWDRGAIRFGFVVKDDGTRVPAWHDSEVAVIAYAIQNIIAHRREALDDSTDTAEVSEHPHPVMSGKKCPECGAHAVIKKDGCSYCTSCGYLGSCG
jgi:ribonucleoside-diphosphate reductase alpha chain